MNERSRGFTMIELMVTVAIVAVLAAVAGPNMSDFIDRQRLVGQTLAIADMAQTARSEAIKRRADTAAGGGASRVIAMTVNQGPPWSIGLAHGNAACTTATTCVLNSNVNAKQWLSQTDAGSCPTCSMTAPSGQIVLLFDYQGMVRGQNAQSAVTLQSPKNNKDLSVRISPLGRISICSPSGTVTGYPTCA